MYRRLRICSLIMLLCAGLAGSANAAVSSRFEMPGREIMGLDLEPGTLWVTHAPMGDSDHMTIAKLDPDSGAVIQETSYDFNGRGICYGMGFLWVVDARYDLIHKIDPVTMEDLSWFSTPGSEPCGVACDGTTLWVSDPWRHRIDRLATDGAVLGGFAIPNAYRTGMEWDDHTGRGMWSVTSEREITLYAPNGAILDTRTVGLDAGDPRVFDVTMDAGRLFASAGSVIVGMEDATAPTYREFALTGRQVMGLDWEPGALWVTHAALGVSDIVTIAKLDPANGAVIAQVEKPYNGRGICYGGGFLWVSDAYQDKVHKLDPVTFAEVASFSTPGSEPCGITFDGAHLWLTDPNAHRIYKLTTTGAIAAQFVIPDVLRIGLEWDARDNTLWTATANDVVSRYTQAGAINYWAALPNVDSVYPTIDIAIAPGHWFVSARERIYDLSDPASRVLAAFPASDAGYSTIQAAVDAASSGDIVSLCPGTFTGAGNTNVAVSSKAVRICAAVPTTGACTLDGGGSSRLFVYSNAGGSLEDITLTGGGGTHFGGAMYLTGSSPALSRCVFTNNLTTGGGSDLALEYTSSPSVTECVFKNCAAGTAEGPIWMRFNCQPRFAFCQIVNNTSRGGDNVLVDINCVATLQNCTIAFNQNAGASSLGVIHVREHGKVYLDKCIITRNNGMAVFANNPATDLAFATATDIFDNRNDGGIGDWTGPLAGQFGVAGNFSAYPLFCGESEQVYTLEDCSPCAPGNSGGLGLIGALTVGNCSCPSPVLDVPQLVTNVSLYPNPFNPRTTISFELRSGGRVELGVYDLRGCRIANLVSGYLPEGRHEVAWNGTDDQGRRQASGTYYCRLVAGDETRTTSMSMIK